MNRLLLSLFFVLFASLIMAQVETGEYSIADVEAHGLIGSTSPIIKTESILDSTTWTSTTSAPNSFGRMVAGVIGDYIYVFTGQNSTSLALAYHIPTKTWINSTPCSAPGYNAAYCVARGELYKLSGSGSINVFEKFTPDNNGTGVWSNLTSPATTLLAAQNSIVFDGNDFIYASSADYSTPTTSYFGRYSVSSDTWTMLTGAPQPKRYAGMAAVQGKIYLIGGLVPTGVDPKACQVYDPATSAWSAIAPTPEDINFSKWSVTSDGTYIWLIGSGGGYSGYSSSNKVYFYDPTANTWTLESLLPAEKGLALGLFMIGHNKLFWGGGNTGGAGTAYTNTCWEGTGGIYIPVELLSFSYEVSGTEITLNWSTATETNNAYFEIERSINNVVFVPLAKVTGNGTTTSIHSYSYSEKLDKPGSYYYRLKQVDFNGDFTYSNTIEVTIGLPEEYSLSQNYPNPFNPATTIKYTIPSNVNSGLSNVKIVVFDMLGKVVTELVNEFKEPGTYEVTLDASQLTSGVYFYRLITDGFLETKKMTLLR
ncbi:MAG TPA: T9SS type A sorting domain-containing protein [Ignavibacteriaceae bacterium]|nr:T9SS type A sorting domain-containing protein [Ignavibacteriaceae bacterium]